MLINISDSRGRDQIQLETDFKLVKELYQRGQKEIHNLQNKNPTFLLMEFIFHPLENANFTRMEAILQSKVVLKNIFIRDVDNGKVIYYGRLKTDTEKFSEAVGDLF